jgi:hypothetical protein
MIEFAQTRLIGIRLKVQGLSQQAFRRAAAAGRASNVEVPIPVASHPQRRGHCANSRLTRSISSINWFAAGGI